MLARYYIAVLTYQGVIRLPGMSRAAGVTVQPLEPICGADGRSSYLSRT